MLCHSARDATERRLSSNQTKRRMGTKASLLLSCLAFQKAGKIVDFQRTCQVDWVVRMAAERMEAAHEACTHTEGPLGKNRFLCKERKIQTAPGRKIKIGAAPTLEREARRGE